MKNFDEESFAPDLQKVSEPIYIVKFYNREESADLCICKFHQSNIYIYIRTSSNLSIAEELNHIYLQ